MSLSQILFLCWNALIEASIFYPKCENGLQGSECQFECKYPMYGEGCGTKCDCEEKYCHYEKGCQLPVGCPAGFTGNYCGVPCTFPKYGLGCQKLCLCSRLRCNAIIGCQTKNDMMVGKMSTVKTTQTPRNATVRLATRSLGPSGAVLELRYHNPVPVQTRARIIERNSSYSESNWSAVTKFEVMKQIDASSSPNPILDHRWIRIGIIVVGVALFFTIIFHIVLSYVRNVFFERENV